MHPFQGLFPCYPSTLSPLIPGDAFHLLSVFLISSPTSSLLWASLLSVCPVSTCDFSPLLSMHYNDIRSNIHFFCYLYSPKCYAATRQQWCIHAGDIIASYIIPLDEVHQGQEVAELPLPSLLNCHHLQYHLSSCWFITDFHKN